MVPVAEPVRSPAASPSFFTRCAWGVLVWNLFVVLWGAFVRISGSGAGCGNHWPLCNGVVVPLAPSVQTIIEFTHRVTSGAVDGLLVIGLAIWSLYRFPRGHLVGKAAGISVVFLILEGALGAGLVRFNYVGQDASIGRALYLSLHLVNTQLLLASVALVAWFSRNVTPPAGRRRPVLVAAVAAALLVSATGVIAALADTVFPVGSLAAGMRQDMATSANFLLRLRIFHPALAILGGGFCIAAAIRVMRSTPHPLAISIATAVMLLTLTQLGFGAMNLALLTPVWMQITHLLLADLVWLSLVLLTVEAGKPIESELGSYADRNH